MTGPSSERDAQLAQTFVALADSLVDDFDVSDVLDHLVHAVVDLLPVEHAGLLLLDKDDAAVLMASTSDSSRMLEYIQLQSAEGGPCLECLHQGVPVSVEDLSAEQQRWPHFATEGRRMGFASVHALPMRLRRQVIGALNLFGNDGLVRRADLVVAQCLADLATIGILQQRTSENAAIEVRQLQHALDSRVVIEQAKGVLAEFGGVDMEAAFTTLRSYARSRNHKLGHVAQRLVTRALDPKELLPPRAGRT